MFDVFISYPHQDKTAADAACAALEAAGVRCWIAPRDIQPGAEWAASIIEAIEQCKVMVLIFSGSANGSKQVQREVQNACDRDVPVIPLRVENVEPTKGLAFFMGPVHWLDALTPPLEQHLERLARRVTALLGATSLQAGTQDSATPPNVEQGVTDEHAQEGPTRPRSAQAAKSTADDTMVDRVIQLLGAHAVNRSDERPEALPGRPVADESAHWTWPFGQSRKRAAADRVADQVAKPAKPIPQAAAVYDLFISHAAEDSAIANAFCGRFEQRGLRCWIAPRDIAPGVYYRTAISAAIGRCRAVLLIFSSSTNTAEQVIREVEFAAERGIPIVPLRIENVAPTRGLRYLLANHQFLG
jgi:TIR domain